MMEYMFFDVTLRDRFVEHACDLGVACTLQGDSMGGLVVGVPEDLPEDKEEAVEAYYEVLQEEQATLVDQSEGGLKKHLAGFRLDLPDGQSSMVALQPDIAKRLMDCFSLEEIKALFSTVAKSALHPQNIPLCKTKLEKS